MTQTAQRQLAPVANLGAAFGAGLRPAGLRPASLRPAGLRPASAA